MKFGIPSMSGAAVVRAAAVLAIASAGAHAAAAAEAARSGYVAPRITHAPYGDVKVVVPLTSPDKRIQLMKLRNISNSLKAADAWRGRFTIKVVLYAGGLTLLENPDEATKAQIDQLRRRGVRFDVCNNSLKEQGIDFHALYHVTDADVVPSGFAEVAYLQYRKHYAVDPVD